MIRRALLVLIIAETVAAIRFARLMRRELDS